MQEIELAQGECSNPPLHDDVSDDYSSYFSDSDIYDYYYDINSDHDSPIIPKWAEKTIQVSGDLAGDPLDSRKTRSQFHNSFSTCELNISERLLLCLDLIPINIKKHHLTQYGKQPCKNISSLFKTMNLGS